MARISLIGCGRWGRHILRDLIVLGCEVSVADPDDEARRHAASAGARRVARDLGELSESEGTVIAATSSTHASLIRRALSRGGPVFVEKPMVCDVREAEELAARAGGRLFVMDKWRYHPGIEALRRIRESGELGRTLGMRVRQSGWGIPHRDVDVAWILLPHSLSVLLEVFGHLPEARWSFAEMLHGQVVALTGVLGADPWAMVEVSARSPMKGRLFQLDCEDGVAWLDDGWADHLCVARGMGETAGDAPEVERRLLPAEMPLLKELQTFLEHLAGGPCPRSSAEEGALAVKRIHQLRHLAGISP